MNGYKASYNNREVEVRAESFYQAQQKAAVLLKAKKYYQVVVVLCEQDGKPLQKRANYER